MRFVRGPIPEDPEFHPLEDGWNSLREPDPIRMQIMAIPFLLVTVAVHRPDGGSSGGFMVFRWNARFLAGLASANGISAAGDLFGLFLIWTQVPPGVLVRNQSWRSYWKERPG